jgi:hypothetical protein
MRSYAVMRRRTIFLCGWIVALVFLSSPPSLAGRSDCTEPWLERCLMDDENCITCDHWCKAVVGEDCHGEDHDCVFDIIRCPVEDFNYYEHCTCQD